MTPGIEYALGLLEVMAAFPQDAQDVINPQAAQEAVTALHEARELAVDVEADAMHAFRARLCFVQVADDSKVFLFDTLASGVTAAPLATLFSDPTRTKFFHAAGGDLQYLAEAGVRVKGLFDTHRAATLLGWQKVGLADLVRERLGIPLAKEHQQSDFSIRPLPPEMRAYIADDVRYLTEIGRQVREACRTADILEEVELDCQRLADEATARPEIAVFRPKLPRGALSNQQLAVGYKLGELLHAKRLAWGETANVPMGRVLSNAAITAMCLKPPHTLKELQRTEGVRGAIVREHGEEILAMIRELEKQAERGELLFEQESKGQDSGKRKREEALKAFRTQKATERKVTPSVVLPNPLVEALAARPPASLDQLAVLPYFGEKRIKLYGSELLTLLQP